MKTKTKLRLAAASVLLLGVGAVAPVVTSSAPVSETGAYYYSIAPGKCIRVAPPGSNVTHLECNPSWKVRLVKWYPYGTGIWPV